jgi:hypothetical protein
MIQWIAWWHTIDGEILSNNESSINANTRDEAIKIALKDQTKEKRLNGVSLIPKLEWDKLNPYNYKR